MVLAVLFTIHNALSTVPARAQVGMWKNYLAYQDVQQIQAAGDNLFVLASNGLYQYNLQDQSIYTFDKTNGLTDSKIANIKWCNQAKRLVAVYSNTNIDLVDVNGNITNVSDIYLKAITGNKTINSVTVDGNYAYLACGFGVVKLNVKNAEISESYMFGRNVTNVVVDKGYIYARITETYQYSDPADFIIPFQGTITIADNWNDNKAHTLAYVVKGSLSDNLIDVHKWTVTSTFPSFAADNTDYDKYIETVKTLNPGGPKYNYFGFMKFVNGKLYTCTGNYSNDAIIQVMNNNDWTIYQREGFAENMYNFRLTCLDVDPLSEDEHVFAGGRSGLYEFRNGNFVKLYNNTNSPIESFNGSSPYYQMVTGTLFDKSGNLWFLNSSAPTASLIKMTPNGQFTKYNHSEYMKYWDDNIKNEERRNQEKEIGVISFYSQQVKCLREVKAYANKNGMRVKLNTVDKFQGMERNIIIVSTVRSNKYKTGNTIIPNNNPGFAKSPERLNVALSRARRLLVVVGNSDFFNQVKNPNNGSLLYHNVIEEMQKHHEIIDYKTLTKYARQ